MFGTNNVESSDDLRMPTGMLADNLFDFINAYELSHERQCFIEDPTDIFRDENDDEINRDKKETICRNKTKSMMTGKSWFVFYVAVVIYSKPSL